MRIPMLYPGRRRPCRYAWTEYWVGNPDAGGRLPVADYDVFPVRNATAVAGSQNRTSSWVSSVKVAWPSTLPAAAAKTSSLAH